MEKLIQTPKAFFLVIAMLFSIIAQAQKPALPSGIIPDGLGYNIHFTDAKPGELEMLSASGATIIRMDFGWNSTERQKGVYDFSAYQRLTDSLVKYKIRPLYILDYSNRNYDEGLSPYTPEGRSAFARWAAAAAVFFKDQGIIWEMYNEPNIHFWRPKPNPDDYILLAIEVGKALREAAPEELYIGPATSEIDFDFLEKCFKAGLLEYWDAVSVHPYRQQPPETVVDEYARLRWMIDRYAPEKKHIPILSAEWGYSSAWGKYNDELQGKMLPRQWMVNLAFEIPVSIWYDWHDDGTDPKEPEHHFGTTNYEYFKDRKPVYNPKPAYIAAKTFNEIFRGFSYKRRLYVGNDDVYILVFSNGQNVRLAAWTTMKEPQTITIPCSPGTFKAITYLGEALTDLSTDLNSLRVTVTDAPIYLIPERPDKYLNDFANSRGFTKNEKLGIWVKFISESDSNLPVNRLMPTTSTSHSSIRVNDSDPVEFNTKTIIYPAYPLIMNMPVIENNELVIRFLNTGGESFEGKLSLNPADGLELAKLSNPLPVSIKEGDLTPTLRLPLKKPVKNSYSLSFSLEQNNHHMKYEIPVKKFSLLDDFSKYNAKTLNESWKILPDGDSKVGSEQSIAPGENGAIQVNYRFDEGWKFLRLAPQPTLATIEGQPQSLLVNISADGSGNIIRLRFRDSSGQTFQVNGDKMSNKGMMYLTFDLTGKKSSSWGGRQDGVIHYPITFDSLIIDSDRKTSAPFSILVNPPVLVYD